MVKPARILAALTLISLLLLALACGDDDDTGSDEGNGDATPAATETAPAQTEDAATEAFPVTIEHKFGSMTVEQEPERVISLGFSEQDPLLALGVVPIAIRDWFGDQPHAVWPWAQDELGGAEPEVLNMPFGELDFERIAALQPDLIVATHSGITEEEYNTLANIAPTLAQTAEYPDFGMPWQEQTILIGRAVGREDLAQELVTDVESQIQATAEEHPEFNGATVAWASPVEGEAQYWAVGPNTPPMRFLAALGFTMPEDLAAAVGELDSAQISSEQITLLDADVLIFQVNTEEARASIESDPLYQQLGVAQDDRTIFFVGLGDTAYGALSFSTVLSLPFALEELVPQLAERLAAD
jgi:iron complex transport system substrate-binding protein